MIPKHELDLAIEIAKKYKIGKLYLIGSSLYEDDEDINDYDFAVNEIPEGVFFKFYGELFYKMSKTVDVIDLSEASVKLKNIIFQEGKLVYEQKAA